MGKIITAEVNLILANIPSIMPEKKKYLLNSVLSKETRNISRNDNIGISVAAKCI